MEVAERLPFPDGVFDLVVSTTSFDHRSDQRAGVLECARMLRPGGRLVLVDQFSAWLGPALVTGRARDVAPIASSALPGFGRRNGTTYTQ